jgi:phage gp29-like protein
MKLFSRKPKKIQPSPSLANDQSPQIPAWQLQSFRHGLSSDNQHDLFDQMQTDSMVQTALTVKKLGVLAAPYELNGDPTLVDFISQNFNTMQGSPFTILQHAMDAFTHGWSIQETIYESRQGKWWLKSVKPKNPKMFTFELDTYENPTALILQLPGEQEQRLPRNRFVIWRHRGGYGRPYGQSDLLPAITHYAAKRDLLNAWKVHLDRFASPTLLGRFNKSATNEDQSAMLHSLEHLAKHSAIVFPDDFEVTSLSDSPSASNGFMEAIDFHNREIARAILGQTLTTDEGRRVGSLAMGKVHLQVLLLQLEAIRRELADVVMNEQIIRPLIELNFGTQELPTFSFTSTPLPAFQSGIL